jgi:hypothetical protein
MMISVNTLIRIRRFLLFDSKVLLHAMDSGVVLFFWVGGYLGNM